MTEPVHYLSTLKFDPAWLADLRAVSPRLVIEQITATAADEISDETWRSVEVLHTSAVFPAPGQAPRLKWVQLDTSGVDHLRELPIWAADTPITTIGGVSPVPLAEYVMFAILGVAHRLPAMLAVRDTQDWPDPDQRWDRFLPVSLVGATVGIVGYGRIGREISRLARAFGMNVVGVTRSGRGRNDEERARENDFGRSAGPDPTEVVGSNALADVVARCDYLVVVVPLTELTRGMVSASVLRECRAGMVLINVARGGIVDESALLDGLRSGRISAAVMDVFDDEPLPRDALWWAEPNVFVTPHVSGLAPLYATQVGQLVAENMRRYLAGEALLNNVDRSRGY